MKHLLTLLLLTGNIAAFTQAHKDIGVILGSSYYLGDFNPTTQFAQQSAAYGFMFRYNTSELYSLRLSGTYSNLKGSHNTISSYIPGNTDPFSTQLFSLESVAEIGFIQFNPSRIDKKSFSPYVLMGIGVAYANNTFIPSIPMGIGVKYSPYNNWTIGAEWRLHKTFYDKIDGYQNFSKPSRSVIHNNDWFGIAGLFVTFRLPNKGALCPVYQ